MTQLSPGVLITETDISNIAPSQAPVAGAFVGEFSWGPIGEPVLTTSESEAVQLWGKPTARTAKHFFGLAQYLNYSRTCQVVRVAHVDSGSNAFGAKNATSSGAGILVKNKTDYANVYETNALASAGSFVAKWAGKLGNSLKIEICDENRTRLVFSSVYVSGEDYEVGETVTQNIDGEIATGIVDSWVDASVGQAGSILNLRQVTGNFQAISSSAYTAWVQSNAYALGAVVRPVTANGFAYEVTTAGTSGGSEPTWPTVVGATVVNGGVTFTCVTQYGILGDTSDVFYQTVSSVVDLFQEWEYATSFDGPPGTSTYVAGRDAVNDEMHMVVVDSKGLFSGTKGTILETWPNVSKASDGKAESGGTSYYVNVLKEQSNYIWWAAHNNLGTNWGLSAEDVGDTVAPGNSYVILGGSYAVQLTGGQDGTTDATDGEVLEAYDLFRDKSKISVRLIMSGAYCESQAVVNRILDIAEQRKDCIGFFSPKLSDVKLATDASKTTAVIAWRNKFRSSSYGVMDSTWFEIYDQYNDVTRFIPANTGTAGLIARTAQNAQPWYSSLGYNRGIYQGVIRSLFVPGETHRDQLFPRGINPIITESGQGIVLFGDKTMLSKDSVFNEIGVRFLFIIVAEAMALASKYYLGEFNDDQTRSRFRSMAKSYLEDIQAKRGITEYKVIADSTNNGTQQIDNGQFVVDILMKPNRSIRFVRINLFGASQGVNFNEIVV
jgi:hypothetical protein